MITARLTERTFEPMENKRDGRDATPDRLLAPPLALTHKEALVHIAPCSPDAGTQARRATAVIA